MGIGLLNRRHAGVDAVIFQFDSSRALHTLQRLAHVIKIADVVAFQGRALLEIRNGLLRTAKQPIGQSAEIERARVFRAGGDRGCQLFIGFLIIARKVCMNSAPIFLPQRGVLSK